MVKDFRPLTALAKALFFWIPNLKIIVSNDDMDDQTRARKQTYGETREVIRMPHLAFQHFKTPLNVVASSSAFQV